MNKTIATNLIAFIVALGGYFSPAYSEIILATGLFALSGSLTNWLAIHMLFEKIPFLYGSGIIPNRFEEFKIGIKQLIIDEFFTRKHIEQFFKGKDANAPDIMVSITQKIDFNRVFESLVEAIEESSLGSMLSMFGGKKALEPLKEPVIKKLKTIVSELVEQQADNKNGDDLTANLIKQVEIIIDNRLKQLTPEKVKNIVQNMIKQHLGWLVVWGGVFGGIIGLLVGLI